MEHLPMTLKAIVDRGTVTEISVGLSGDSVYRIEAGDTYYLKIGASLTEEHQRLEWLDGRLPAPKMLHFEVNQGKHYLLTSAIQGEMVMQVDLPIERCLELLAEAAHLWHALPIDDCPFRWGLQAQIESARHNLNHHRVDARDFGDCYYGKSENELFADLLNAIPDADEDLVVTHGDLCLPNILIDPQTERIAGFVDVGLMGVSDRYQDLVLTAWSIGYNFGTKYIPRFYDLYGIQPDPAKKHFYSILNQFI